MASRLQLPGSLSLVVVVLVVCAFAAQVDASSCAKGWGTCPSGPECGTNLSSDVNNCGKCFVQCPKVPHATTTCKNRGCYYICDKRNGWADCDGWKLSNGCEINTNTGKMNCGRCGNDYPTEASDCVGGVCVIPCEPESPTRCSSNCVDLTSDILNCGRCGKVCATSDQGETSCGNGNCIIFSRRKR